LLRQRQYRQANENIYPITQARADGSHGRVRSGWFYIVITEPDMGEKLAGLLANTKSKKSNLTGILDASTAAAAPRNPHGVSECPTVNKALARISKMASRK